ncbi:Mur ligase [Leptodontidium sp. MPI-SDFR-AT-0119]|nr:Mur ligase [Leptodontidium sp. MPI-SDFR-AT-0119]
MISEVGVGVGVELQQIEEGLTRLRWVEVAVQTRLDAINLLNTLQTPYEVLKKRWDANIKLDEGLNQEIRKCLARIGYSQRDLDKLNIVHVAGTKGKGGTCAYVDSMLSHYRKSHGIPHNIGLFTSPHLIAVRERIRINSAPISADLFAKYFFEVWDRLESAAATSDVPFEKPVYFRYLNLMSYHVFLQENVDAAIYEVGVGGEYDSTNIVDRPAVTGISTLGIDHTFTLGDTIDKIAWHKAGIQKKGVPSFTVPQLPAAMQVVEKRAEERSVKSFGVVGLDSRLEGVKIRPDAPFQKSNASLAIALTETLLKTLDPKFCPDLTTLPKEFVNGLEQVVWRGRCETKVDGEITWYLDGAHTADSIVVAAQWFGDECAQKSGPRILIFNQQGHRESVELLEGLYNAIKTQNSVKFDHVIFCPTVPPFQAFKKDHVNLSTDSSAVAGLTMQNTFAEKWRILDPSSSTTIHVLPSVEAAFDCVRELSAQGRATKESGQVHALITGSVHLIGRALGILESAEAL